MSLSGISQFGRESILQMRIAISLFAAVVLFIPSPCVAQDRPAQKAQRQSFVPVNNDVFSVVARF